MNNLKVYLPLVNGSLMDCEFFSGRDFIHKTISDDFGPPPTSLCIEVKSAGGKTVIISIPYDLNSDANVTIDGKQI